MKRWCQIDARKSLKRAKIEFIALSQVRNFVAPSMNRRIRGEQAILLFNRDLCREEPDLPDSYISDITHSPDPNGVERRTSIIRTYSPSAGMVRYYL